MSGYALGFRALGSAFSKEVSTRNKETTSVLACCWKHEVTQHPSHQGHTELSSSLVAGKSNSPGNWQGSTFLVRRTESLALFLFLLQMPGNLGKFEA